jgi:hypothetical protein
MRALGGVRSSERIIHDVSKVIGSMVLNKTYLFDLLTVAL